MLITPNRDNLNKIVVIKPKGGCGKTTLATNVASYYAKKGPVPAVMDCDAQGSTMLWLDRRHWYEFATAAGLTRRIHRRRTHPVQLRRSIDDQRGAGGTRVWAICLSTRPGSERRRQHHDGCRHRCSAGCPESRAPGQACPRRPGPYWRQHDQRFG
ncbi:MAG: ParA family protein [Proteobacteria bacterium]|nr:ParA family protein [Pseudomonadota bacterium]